MTSRRATSRTGLYVGVLSGTSADAIDAAILDFGSQSLSLLATCSLPFPPELKQQVIRIAESTLVAPEEIGELDRELGLLFGQAVIKLLEQADIDAQRVRAIGSHGLTIRHRPPRGESSTLGFTWQIGDPNTIAESTGICTVADFRRRDIAAGGQGAPLVPAFHAHAFRSPSVDRVTVNIGGMANLTLLPRNPAAAVSGFDTGPGNALLDAWVRRHLGREYDASGAWAKSGRIDASLLARMRAHPFLALRAPKSTGREEFNLAWLESCRIAAVSRPEDVQATLLEFTATTIANALIAEMPACLEVLVCGGGTRNTRLMERLQELLPEQVVATTAAAGIEPEWVEASLFAWLARCRLDGVPANLPSVTGARRLVCLGGVYSGSNPARKSSD